MQHGRNGLVVPEKEPSALRDALELLLRDPQRANWMGEQARVDAAAFSHDRMADAFEAAVAHAVRSSAARA